MKRNVSEYGYLTWSVFMSWYWLVFPVNETFPSIIPASTSFLLVFTYAVAMLRRRSQLKQVTLIFHLLHAVLFSVLVYRSDVSCGCYQLGIVDFVPGAISFVMSGILLVTLRLNDRIQKGDK